MKNVTKWMLATIAILDATTATAATDFSLLGTNISLSGFATAGFAISDQRYNYQRFLNNDGTFKRDSLFGLQMDAKLTDEFSITVQAKVAPSTSSNNGIDPTLTWAFLSWRPTNDLLFRGGKLRVPLYLNSANTDIGATFDFARLPSEVYAAAPTTDINGAMVSKIWNLDAGELTLDGYVGTADAYYRQAAYNYPPLSSGASYTPMNMNAYGSVLTFQHDDDIFRIGAHDAYIKFTDGSTLPVTFPFVSIMPGVGYYQTSKNLPGSGIPEVSVTHTLVYTVAADIALDYGFRITGEYVCRDMRNISTGPGSQGGYLALLKSFDAWTPYVSVAHLQSMDKTLDLYNQVSRNRVPNTIPNAAMLNAAQQVGATSIDTYDQTTVAVGTAYRLNPTSKLKVEWAITKIGEASSFIDAPAGELSGNRLINVFSFSYSVVF